MNCGGGVFLAGGVYLEIKSADEVVKRSDRAVSGEFIV